MQEEEITLEEILILMTEKMLAMNQRIEVLNERQNRIDNQELQTNVPTDGSRQIHIPGL